MSTLRRIGVINPHQIRHHAARAYPKHGGNGHGTPEYVILEMWRVYSRTHSLSAVGTAFGRSKQAIAYLFHRRGLLLKRRGGDNRSPLARIRHARP